MGFLCAALIVSSACRKKEKRVLRTEPWPAPVALSASGALPSAPPGKPVHYVVDGAKVSFELPARKKKPSGTLASVSGELELDVQHPENTRGELRAYLLSINCVSEGREP